MSKILKWLKDFKSYYMAADPMLDAKEKYHLRHENGYVEKRGHGYVWVEEKPKNH